MQHFDVLIVGAGLSGVDAAHHLNQLCPRKTYALLDQRERIGGTWDLFRYPGIRSDSDMFTMGYGFRPWTSPTTISPGDAIRNYIAETARDEGIDRHIRFRHKITAAAWSSETAAWIVHADTPGGPAVYTCHFLFSCAGYYRYESGYLPEFPGIAGFKGAIVHPQAWPENLDYANKRILVIGSGATAVTLLPAMAETAAHVTMLQRSPTWIISRPIEDPMANWLRARFSPTWAFRLTRWRNILLGTYIYRLCQTRPEKIKALLLKGVREALGPEHDISHFTPRYNPWEQRLCLVPDNDLFKAIRSGKADVVTDQIATFTERGVKLKSGRELEADVIVTATGLVMQAYGGIDITVDGRPIDLSQTITYKGVMISGVPNFAAVFGYINASWTLRADLICHWFCRLLNYMDRRQVREVVAQPGSEKAAAPFVENFSSGYMQRALASWPKQGSKKPWRAYQNYLRDIATLKWAPIANSVLKFSNPPKPKPQSTVPDMAAIAERGGMQQSLDA